MGIVTTYSLGLWSSKGLCDSPPRIRQLENDANLNKEDFWTMKSNITKWQSGSQTFIHNHVPKTSVWPLETNFQICWWLEVDEWQAARTVRLGGMQKKIIQRALYRNTDCLQTPPNPAVTLEKYTHQQKAEREQHSPWRVYFIKMSISMSAVVS
jgi:hypothetical protein